MDEEEIDIKDELIDQNEFLQFKDKSIDQLSVLPLTENNNILNKEMHIKDEPINQGYLLSSKEHTNFTNSSNCQKTKQEIPETCEKSEPFNEPEKNEIFISYEIYESDVPLKMSTMNCDPLHIPVHEGKMQKKGPYQLEIHETIQNSNVCGKEKPAPKSLLKNKIVFPCCICFKVFQAKSDLRRHTLSDHKGKRSKIIQPLQNTDEGKYKNEIVPKDECSVCLKVFRTRTYLKKHLSRIHKFECQLCPVKFVRKMDRIEHVSLVHPNEPKYPDSKGQLILKCFFGVTKSTKKNNEIFVRISALAS